MRKQIGVLVGHGRSEGGGYDPGACAKGYEEFKLARECAKYANEYLNSQYDCRSICVNYDGSLSLNDRINMFRTSEYDLIAEIHLNAGGGTGPEVYYSNGNAAGKKAAEQISARIAADFGLRNRGAKVKLKSNGKDYFAIIRETVPDAVLVETLFIDTDDVGQVASAVGQEKMGISIAKGIAGALGLKEKEAGKPSEPDQPEEKPSAPSKTVQVGSMVRVKEGAKSYEGKKIASFVFEREYRVDELKGERAVLDKKGICTAFHTRDLILISGGSGAKPSAPSKTYTIQKGDSFWKIAEEQLGSGSRYKELAAYNGMKPTDTIYAGQKLKLPQ